MKDFPDTAAALSRPNGYSHVVRASGQMVFVAGQVAVGPDGRIVGEGDVGAQAEQAMKNVAAALAAAGASFTDIVKLNTYVVGLRPDMLPAIRKARGAFLSADHPPASTLIGVTALAAEGLLVEIEAVAVID